MIWTVAKKELRGYFHSAIAVSFLAAFLKTTIYVFFYEEKFFARGVADLRPLFEWMPELLIILVSALAMRQWADERRGGTLEVLLTLPVPRWQLVLGKFTAGMVMIAVALGLTLGLPLTVAQMGNLDLGPVVGGYLATLLLGATYLVVGMCVSAAASNQMVAFVGTAIVCAILYALGDFGGELGRALGTEARFESVARGVLDLRDLAYYGGVVCTGIAVNVLILQSVSWGSGTAARPRRVGAVLTAALVAANAIALVVWLAPVRGARIDLTEDGAYSLSGATEKIVGGLDERLLIRGYFSERTHPELAPLVPQIKDLLEEYRVAGDGKVRVELVDPTSSDAAKREAKERFGIDPTPVRFATETEKSVINTYFAIAIEYGDQHAVLDLEDLIDVRVTDVDDIEISLRNLEYQVTKAIKTTVSKFSSVDALFASTTGKVQLTAYITPKTLPENWKDAPQKLQKVVDGLAKRAGGKLAFTQVEPKTEAEMRELFEKYGLRPYSDLLSSDVYYFHLLLQVGHRIVRIVPPQNLGEADLEKALDEGLERAAPGFTRVVGLWTPEAPPPMPMIEGMPPQRMPPPQSFETLRRRLAASYELRNVTLAAPVPDDVETLVLAGPANLDAKAAEHVDQFLMRGGAIVALAGRYRLAPSDGLAVEKVTTGLETLLQKWGITIADELVMDTKSDSLPIPENRDLGNGLVVREIHQLAYPFFVRLDGDQLSSSSVITGGLTGSVMHWASPVKAELKVGDDQRRVETLLKTSGASWLTSSTQVQPDPRTYPQTGFPGPNGLPADKRGAQVVAVAITGGFTSTLDKTANQLAHSPPDARVVVFGSSAFVSDDVLALAEQLDSDLALANLELVHNAVDWSLADTDLLSIRSRSAARRALTIAPDARSKWRTANIAIAFAGLVFVAGIPFARRRMVRPITDGKEA